jgi:hypothetical protein
MSTKKIQIIGSLGSNVELDNTLTESGKAADAKAVGEIAAEMNSSIQANAEAIAQFVSIDLTEINALFEN